jgi:hypothetical protein
MFKVKILTLMLALSASPLAFGLCKLALGTKLGGISGGGPLMD